MKSQTGKGYLFLLAVVVLSALSAFLYQQNKYLYGLDVEGGVRLTYDIQFDKDPAIAERQRKELSAIRANMVSILNNRAAQALGVVESNVQPKGETEFIIELPGYTDVNTARTIIGSTAKIEAYSAKTVDSPQRDFREYRKVGSETDNAGNPYETFVKKTEPDKILKPTDPGYKEMIAGWEKILEGSDLQAASIIVNGARTQPNFRFSPSGANKLETWSRSVAGQEENLAFVLDGIVLSFSHVSRDVPFLREEAYINGDFEPTYVKNLVTLLNSGALPVELKETSSMTVDPTIGKQALNQMVMAGAVSFGIIALFLLVYYIFPGFVALIALLLYILFTLTVLKLIGATFSLAAIAGFILSVSMAVDANILVFERVKEEMRDGRSLMTAVELGFKRAFPAILDSNMCTILTSLVLSVLGTGPVKGFATTLIVGVAISLFTAVVVTRSLLVFLVAVGPGNNPKLYGLGRNWFGEGMEATADTKPLQVIKRTKMWFVISLVTMLIGLPFMLMGGLKQNVEFTGGAEAVFNLEQASNLNADQVSKNLERGGYPGSIVKFGTTSDGKRQVYATIPSSAGLDLTDENVKAELVTRLQTATGLNVAPASLTTIGPSVAEETKRTALLGVLISSALIVVYLAIRFGVALGGLKNGIRFGLSAIGALIHDIVVVLGLAAIVGYFLKWEISALSITAMLTVIGFSVHDTIVIFDRIRENLRKPVKGETFENLCNRSITSSVARSINTGLTVIATLIILIVWGTPTPDLKFFCVAMLFGILSGTYSSIFNATPILWLWDRAIEKRKGYDATLIAESLKDQARLRANQMAVGADGVPQSYGTVKRRNRVKDKARQDLDE